jgi:hypothetical protein
MWLGGTFALVGQCCAADVRGLCIDSVPPRALTLRLRFRQQVRLESTHQLFDLIRPPLHGAGFAHLTGRHQRARFL